jgi:hypothetical protein
MNGTMTPVGNTTVVIINGTFWDVLENIIWYMIDFRQRIACVVTLFSTGIIRGFLIDF